MINRKQPAILGRPVLAAIPVLLLGAGLMPALSAAAQAAPKTYTIALVPGLTTDPFYITMEHGAKAEARKLGANLIWEGGTSFSPETQIPVLQALIAKHPSALLVAPTNDKALINPIKQYVDAKIPVLSVDTTIADASLLKSKITSNNIQGGKAAAEAIAKFAHERGDVAVINVKPGVSTTDDRQKGFLEQIKKYPNMKVVAIEYDNDSPTKAFTDTQLILLKHPKLKGVFGTNLYSAEGAGKAVAASGKKGKVVVFGYDAEPDEVKLLRQGVISGLVIQRPAKEGALAVRYAYDVLTGHGASVPRFVQLNNVIATTQNANDPAIKKYFYKTSISH